VAREGGLRGHCEECDKVKDYNSTVDDDVQGGRCATPNPARHSERKEKHSAT